MAVYVDSIQRYPKQGLWCHMYADSLDELHDMADKIGLKREWLHYSSSLPHYDLRLSMRLKAIANGAVEDVDRKPFMRLVREYRQNTEAHEVHHADGSQTLPGKLE